jgi:hypothetical protein
MPAPFERHSRPNGCCESWYGQPSRSQQRAAAVAEQADPGVIPQARPAGVFTTHGFSLYDRRTVIVGVRTGTSFITDPRDVAEYSKLFGELEELAVFGEHAGPVIRHAETGYRLIAEAADDLRD